MKAVEIADIRKRYKSLQTLKNVSLSIKQGEFFGLLGPNGVSKATLISILASLNRAGSSSVRVLDHDVAPDYRTARRRLDMVPQELVFDPFFMVYETLRLQSGYFGPTRNDNWIDEVMTNLDLTNKADADMRALSDGMECRMLVTQVLVHRPPVIMLDRPAADVDVELRQTLWEFISRLNHEGHTIVLAIHYLEEAESLCDRVAMLKFGEMVALDCTVSLLSRFAGLQLILSFAKGVLPASLESLHLPDNHGEHGVRLRLSGYGEVGQTLSIRRLAGCEVDDMEIAKADLEDVFVQIMRCESGLLLESQAPAIPDSALEPVA